MRGRATIWGVDNPTTESQMAQIKATYDDDTEDNDWEEEGRNSERMTFASVRKSVRRE